MERYSAVFVDSSFDGFRCVSFQFCSLIAWQQLILQVVVAIVYIGLAKLFGLQSFAYLLTTVSELSKQRRTAILCTKD